MKINAAIFDIGNVLLLFDYMIAANRLVEKNKLANLPDREKIVTAKEDYESGKINRQEFLLRVRPEFNDLGPEEDFVKIWQEIFKENLPMTSLARELSEKMPVYLISNISCIHHDHIVEKYPVFGVFKDGVFSYRAGMMKPHPDIYHLAIRQFGVNPHTTLFFDDMPENIAAAKEAGLVAIHYDHQNHDEILNRIRDHLSD